MTQILTSYFVIFEGINLTPAVGAVDLSGEAVKTVRTCTVRTSKTVGTYGGKPHVLTV